MSRALADLDLVFRPIAEHVLAQLVEAHVPVLIVETRRTQAQQDLNVATGHSWVTHSKHQDGLALDLVPYELYTAAPGGDKLSWNTDAAAWQVIGRIGKAAGCRWGGDWTVKDMGHLEYVEPTG